MTKLFLVPIEPLEERYSASWYRNFPDLFRKKFPGPVEVIDGIEVSKTVNVGTFLDINATVQYKASQLAEIAMRFEQKDIPSDSVFFFYDLEFWGIESVRLLAQLNRVPVSLCGFLHAASYTMGDAFAVAAPYQKYTEVGWISCMDKVFVGSKYHKEVVVNTRLSPLDAKQVANRIIVTKNPVFLQDYEGHDAPKHKKRKILLTNRSDPEKRPHQTLALFQALHKQFPEWEYVVTTSRSLIKGDHRFMDLLCSGLNEGWLKAKPGLTKKQYHDELREASIVVTHSLEENYGYCVAEAILYGALPLMPACASHLEFSRDRRLFFDGTNGSDYEKACMLMEAWGTPEWPNCPTLDVKGAENIVSEVCTLARR